MTDEQFDKLLDVLDRNFSALEQHLMVLIAAVDDTRMVVEALEREE
jgi:hypothetical protein